MVLHCPPAQESLLKPHESHETYTTDPGSHPPVRTQAEIDFPMPEYDYFASMMSLPYTPGGAAHTGNALLVHGKEE